MIDEKKLIEEIHKYFRDRINEDEGEFIDDKWLKLNKEICGIIKSQPKVGEWIPCSEELPPMPTPNPLCEGRNLELYLVTEKHGDYPWRAFWNGKSFSDGFSKVEVIAWMPLPEPYRKDVE